MRARNERLYKKNGYLMHLQIPPFCIKTNLRENRLFVARLTVREKQELFLRQFSSESFTKITVFVYTHMSNDTYKPYANNRQRLRLLGLLLTANKNYLMCTQYKYYSVDNILGLTGRNYTKEHRRNRIGSARLAA